MPNRLYPTDSWRLKALSPRLLHSHFGYVAVDDHQLQKSLDVPWIVSFYGADVYQLGRLPVWQEKYASVFERAARVLALGPVMASHLEELGCPPHKIRVHPLGVDVENLPARPRVLRSGEPLRILFAGTFREKKGIRYVIECAALARQAGVSLELHLVGDAAGKPGDLETKNRVLQQIEENGLKDVVVHYPFLSFPDLVALSFRMHIFIAPSVTAADGDAEGTPFVLQQMMATGMPVMATTHSDIPFIFGELKNLLVPERDAKMLAARLQTYAGDPDALVRDGMAFRHQICTYFDVRGCATRLADLYDEIV